MRGAFAERSNSASSYRGELLGMLAIHLFLLAVEERGGLDGGTAEVHCDNKGAIYTFDKEGKKGAIRLQERGHQESPEENKGAYEGKAVETPCQSSPG